MHEYLIEIACVYMWNGVHVCMYTEGLMASSRSNSRWDRRCVALEMRAARVRHTSFAVQLFACVCLWMPVFEHKFIAHSQIAFLAAKQFSLARRLAFAHGWRFRNSLFSIDSLSSWLQLRHSIAVLTWPISRLAYAAASCASCVVWVTILAENAECTKRDFVGPNTL